MGVTATAIGTFLGLQGATATVVGATAILAATTAVSYGVAKLTMPDLDDFSQLGKGGRQLNTKEPNAPIEIVYGAVRKGGVITYQTTTSSQVLGIAGGNNRVLRQIIVVAGHEVYDMNPTRIWLDDVEWVVNEYGYVTNQKYVDGVLTTDNRFQFNGSTNRSYLFVGKHRGNQTSPDDLFQGLSALDGRSGSMSLNHFGVTGPLNNHPLDGNNDALADFVGRGIAFMYVEMIFDPEVFDNIPLVTTLVEGKKVYDPEFGTTAYSNNPAHCILDYLESEYGLNVDTAYTDRGTTGTFKLAADDCDTDSGSTPNNAFKCNGILSGADSHKTNLEKLLSSCDGTLIFSGGKWKLIIGKDRSSTATTLTLDNFRGPIRVQTKASKSERFNEVGGDFVDASNRWLQGSYPAIKSATFLSDDDNQVSRFEFSLPMTTSSVIAQRLAKIQLYRSREEVVVTVRCDLAALDLDVGDWVKLVIDRYGWISSQNKYFEVRGYSMVLENGAPEIELVLKEISSAVFDWDSEEADITTNDAYPFSIGNILSSLNSLATPTATASGYFLSDGTYQPTIDVTWSGLDDIYLDGYQLKYYVTSAGDSTAAEITLGRDATFYRILTDGSSDYTIELRAFSGRTMGIYKTLTKTSAEDTTAPAVPTSFSVTAGHKHVAIQATAPSDSDFQAIEIYRVAAGGNAPTSSTTPSFSISGAPATVLKTIDDNLANGTALDFYARSRDYTGNTSDWTEKETATPTQEYTDGATVGATVGLDLNDSSGTLIENDDEIKNDQVINVPSAGGDGKVKNNAVVTDSITDNAVSEKITQTFANERYIFGHPAGEDMEAPWGRGYTIRTKGQTPAEFSNDQIVTQIYLGSIPLGDTLEADTDYQLTATLNFKLLINPTMVINEVEKPFLSCVEAATEAVFRFVNNSQVNQTPATSTDEVSDDLFWDWVDDYSNKYQLSKEGYSLTGHYTEARVALDMSPIEMESMQPSIIKTKVATRTAVSYYLSANSFTATQIFSVDNSSFPANQRSSHSATAIDLDPTRGINVDLSSKINPLTLSMIPDQGFCVIRLNRNFTFSVTGSLLGQLNGQHILKKPYWVCSFTKVSSLDNTIEIIPLHANNFRISTTYPPREYRNLPLLMNGNVNKALNTIIPRFVSKGVPTSSLPAELLEIHEGDDFYIIRKDLRVNAPESPEYNAFDEVSGMRPYGYNDQHPLIIQDTVTVKAGESAIGVVVDLASRGGLLTDWSSTSSNNWWYYGTHLNSGGLYDNHKHFDTTADNANTEVADLPEWNFGGVQHGPHGLIVREVKVELLRLKK